ncbi:MAG: L-lactate dehydrogenase [Rhodospirillaceae bacterium]
MFAANVMDYRALAKRRLPRFMFEYIDGGAFAEATLRRNVSDFEDLPLKQRILGGVGDTDTTATLFGRTCAMPLALAPIGLAGLNARRGEIQAARAAEAAGVPFILSTMSVCTMEEVRGKVAPFWFQLYVMRDRGFMRDMIARAKAAGCTALVFTVDMPVPGVRYRDMRSGLSAGGPIARRMKRLGQALASPSWAWDVGLLGGPHTLGHVTSALKKRAGVEEFWAWTSANFDPTVTWKDIEAIHALWDGPLIVKGVLDPDDARAAADVGVQGIIVSNHGGRQLDGALSSIRALPSIAKAVGDRTTVLMDGGIRTGADIVRALSLGAKGVLIGRAWAWALAAKGEAGVAHVLRILEKEMRVAMALTGAARISDLGPDRLDLRSLRELGF